MKHDEERKKKSIRDIPIPEGRHRSAERTSSGVRRPQEAPKQPVSETTKPPEMPEVTNEVSVAEAESAPEPKRPSVATRHAMDMDEPAPRPERRAPRQMRRSTFSRTKLFSIIGGVVVLVVVFAFFTLGGAELKVTPKAMALSLTAELTGQNIAAQNNDEPSAADVRFAVTELVAEASRDVEATGEEEVVQKASGEITIYNEYTEEEQRLVKETRFESPNGRIYRIPESVLVPGLTRDDNGDVIPGQVTVEVFADEAGEEYNTGPVRYTVPGFEGLPQFDGFYAQGEGSISGGFNGVKKIVSDEDRNNAERELREEIKAALQAQATEQSTDELLMFTDESLTLYELLEESIAGESVTITMRGTAKGIVIAEEELAAAVAEEKVSGYNEGDPISIANIDDINVRVYSASGNVATNTMLETVRIALQGDASFVWKIDTEALQNAVAGVERKSLQNVLDQFTGITRADASLSPFWKKSFPEDADDITIIVAEKE